MDKIASRKIILGSSSSYRRRVMESLGLHYEVVSPDIDEKAIRDDDPRALVCKIGAAKAAALRGRMPVGAIIITSDQVAEWGGTIREKPADAAEARRWLTEYVQQPVGFTASVVVTDTGSGRQLIGADTVQVAISPMSSESIERAIARGDILHCCGAFAIDDPDIEPYVVKIIGEGTEQEKRDSVVGLPTRLLRGFLHELGVTVPRA